MTYLSLWRRNRVSAGLECAYPSPPSPKKPEIRKGFLREPWLPHQIFLHEHIIGQYQFQNGGQGMDVDRDTIDNLLSGGVRVQAVLKEYAAGGRT
jgi:hypothetical protein